MMFGGFCRIISLRHATEIKKESRGFFTIVRKILGAGNPLSLPNIALGGFYKRGKHHSRKRCIIICNKSSLYDIYISGGTGGLCNFCCGGFNSFPGFFLHFSVESPYCSGKLTFFRNNIIPDSAVYFSN